MKKSKGEISFIEQQVLNEGFAKLMEQNGIKKINFVSIGNSISSGYRWVNKTQPLLFRNTTIGEILKNHNIKLNRYHFARTENNSEQHVYNWLINNTSLSEINRYNVNDSGTVKFLTEDEVERFYPMQDVGIQDVMFDKSDNLSNIFVYNGITGSFLDVFSRNGNYSPFSAIKNDLYKLDAILAFIQNANRTSDTNIQIYLCGVPKYFGMEMSLFNEKLKNIARNYANVVYVDSVFVLPIFYENSKLCIDIHPTDIQYQNLNNNIVESITNNYELVSLKIEIDRFLYNQNIKNELSDKDKYIAEEYLREVLSKSSCDNPYTRENICSYLLRRYPHEYYYIDRKSIKRILKK